MRPFSDNVFVTFEPEETITAGGLHIPQQVTEKTRRALVIAVGPGWHTKLGVFIPTTVKPGETVLLDRLAGQNYDWDLNIPRHNKKGCEWGDESSSFRAVREEEILAVVEGESECEGEGEP